MCVCSLIWLCLSIVCRVCVYVYIMLSVSVGMGAYLCKNRDDAVASRADKDGGGDGPGSGSIVEGNSQPAQSAKLDPKDFMLNNRKEETIVREPGYNRGDGDGDGVDGSEGRDGASGGDGDGYGVGNCGVGVNVDDGRERDANYGDDVPSEQANSRATVHN